MDVYEPYRESAGAKTVAALEGTSFRRPLGCGAITPSHPVKAEPQQGGNVGGFFGRNVRCR